MVAPGNRFRQLGLLLVLSMLVAGCATSNPTLPAGHLPPSAGATDVRTASYLQAHATPDPEPKPLPKPDASGRAPFELPPNLPGARAATIAIPRLPEGASAAERDQAIRAIYPDLKAPAATLGSTSAADHPFTLMQLQQMARAASPALRKAQAEADAALGSVIQAGLHPNPTVGYQADQWQPGNRPSNNNGQQGAFLNQTIKWPHKLTLAQSVAGFDFLNARVAARRAEIDLANNVRSAYFSVLLARQSKDTHRALVEVADDVYRLQLKRVAGGDAAGYEPLALYAQAVQARNALIAAEAGERSAWRQMAALIGQPDLPMSPLAGSTDVAPPAIDAEKIRQYVTSSHTDILTARNSVEQAEVNLRLQQIQPRPDLLTNTIVQHDNSSGNKQFSIQIGVSLPIFDRNQGNIQQAIAQVARARESLSVTSNDLLSRLADAQGRYEAQTAAAESYRDKVIPSLARSYRAMIRRYQAEPDKVGFNDIVTAQQNYAQALQQYLSALDAQWKAVVDLANLSQQDDLYAEAKPETSEPLIEESAPKPPIPGR